ncbi:hypothetical protein I4U23_017542 [Adineta vaga]|nr:hypothetical protein I4U23_017542 [Adineta vaga]
MNRTTCILFILLLIVSISYFMIMMEKRIDLRQISPIHFSKLEKNFLDGCRYVYIDMGTNIGIQIRKLYQPDLYPDAAVVPLFKEMFGNYSDEVCSVGFEANPLHTSYLEEFENFYLKQN